MGSVHCHESFKTSCRFSRKGAPFRNRCAQALSLCLHLSLLADSLGTEFAADVHSTLQNPRGTDDDDLLLADVSHHVKSCAALSQKGTPTLSPKTAKNLERNGRNLWNLCVRFRREHADQVLPDSRARLLTRVRLFAYQLIALAREGGRSKQSDETGDMYMTNLAINVGRLCLECMDIDSAKWALERAAECLEHLKDLSDKNGSTSARICDLEGDFLVVRIVLVRCLFSFSVFVR